MAPKRRDTVDDYMKYLELEKIEVLLEAEVGDVIPKAYPELCVRAGILMRSDPDDKWIALDFGVTCFAF